jgi:hypothetical protein
MEQNRDQPTDPQAPQARRPRRFVYRSAEPDNTLHHPLRRSTDMPHEFQGITGRVCTHPLLLKFRVYLKLN